jgi:hypothetical protein
MRSQLARLLVVFGLLFARPTFGAAPESPAQGEPAGIRTGTTEIAAVEQGDEPAHEAPSDAPRFRSDVTLPPPPEGFNTFDGGWIRFVYHPSIRERVQPLISEADAIKRELSARLGQSVLSNVRVQIARTPGEMATFAPAGAPYPEYAAGVAYSEIGLVLLTLVPVHPNSNHDLGEIFRHELAHVALEDAVGKNRVPRWFNEGFAVLASGETSLVRLQTLWTATLADKLLTLQQMDRSFPRDETDASIAYAQAVDIVRYLVRQQDYHRFRGLIARMRDDQPLDAAILDSYGIDLPTLEYEWKKDVAKRYTFWPVLFSGTVVWVGALGLFVWGWRRRKRRAQATLQRWAREEAAEDGLQRTLAEQNEPGRIHIVLARGPLPAPQVEMPPPQPEAGIPKVEHDGQWHTLH